MPSRKPGSFLEDLCRWRNHQKEPRAGTHPLKPLTDGDLTFAPRLQGASNHGASPPCAHSHMGGGETLLGSGRSVSVPL